MDEAEQKTLDREVRRLKRIASEHAAALHDLVEERLPAAYEELIPLSQSTYNACKAWSEANARLALALKEQHA